ncbi:hypothetical protein ACRQ5D_34465 [Mucilaginibacter sp. P25]|uniref:hypothetical protein n=1 Tax=Mucilaginibacter sp. P25 TaxID=3423945 RepID=UPI003D7BCED3
MGDTFYDIPKFPRTVVLMQTFFDVFIFFIFFIIIFYTGETIHRDRLTRYAHINDSLPTPNWVLNGSRLLSLIILSLFLSMIPLIMGVAIQVIKGYLHFEFSIYFMEIFTLILPRFLEMVIFSYFIHVLINNKFAAHAIGIIIWVVLFFLHISKVFNYNILLFSYTPDYIVSDMNGIGHMWRPVFWFNLYWLLGSGLMIIAASLFFYRGYQQRLESDCNF